jgi:hypothetical protein
MEQIVEAKYVFSGSFLAAENKLDRFGKCLVRLPETTELVAGGALRCEFANHSLEARSNFVVVVEVVQGQRTHGGAAVRREFDESLGLQEA